ncbi:2'-5' RNA ligase family protein [Formosa sp. S-31]|uniref:2'-5' RNA ligase family protein n=1 Tax=Formosa sp. S-31 TaxID=2790949 RepID=UPI003EBA21B4
MFEIKTYNLRIVPPSPVYEDVLDFKKQFIDVFGVQKYSKSKPHLTLVEFKMDVQYEPFLIKYFSSLSDNLKFKMFLEGLGSFDKALVVLLKVRSSKAFEQLLTQIKILWVRDFHRKLKSLKVSGTPHITISLAKDTDMLFKSMNMFQDKVYFGEFEVNELVLVSRPDSKTWDWEHRIPLS